MHSECGHLRRAVSKPLGAVRLTEMLQDPLAHIIQSVEQLEETPLTGPQRHHVETLHSASETVIRLLTRLLEVAVAAASTNPARLMGMAAVRGSIAAGLVADLIHLDADLRPLRIMRNGAWLQ